MTHKLQQLLQQYSTVPQVQQLIFVRPCGGSQAQLQLYTKTIDNSWEQRLVCPAYIGQNGIGKTQEGDKKTPIGDFGIFTAVGVKPNPGTKAAYVLLDEHIYAASGPYYNKLLDDRLVTSDCVVKYDGDTFLDAQPQFNYGLFLDYNKECLQDKGSYIFLHCTGSHPYTYGCVAISEDNMLTVLRAVDNQVRICIYPD